MLKTNSTAVKSAFIFVLALLPAASLAGSTSISGVDVSKSFFNPSIGEAIEIRFISPADGTFSLLLLDRDGYVVRTLEVNKTIRSGSNSIQWDGRDDNGKVVPDEAYFYVATVTDGTNNLTWDLTGVAPDSYTNSYEIKPAWDPFNNGPLIFTVNISPGQNRILIAFSPNYIPGNPHGVIDSGCDPPNFCPLNYEYRESGTHTIRWAGADASGAFRPDMQGYVLSRVAPYDNAVVVFGTRPKISTGVTASPPLFYPHKGSQTISFAFSSFQNQPSNITVTFINQSSLSTLRTINQTSVNPGTINIAWDGKADNGIWVAPGGYTVTVKITDSIGNTAVDQILTTVRY